MAVAAAMLMAVVMPKMMNKQWDTSSPHNWILNCTELFYLFFLVVVECGLSYFDGTVQIPKSLKIDKEYRIYGEGLSWKFDDYLAN
jgi:hypothetical protein